MSFEPDSQSQALLELAIELDLDRQLRDELAYLHQRPELSGEEWETAEHLQQFCQAQGCLIHPLANNPGFIAELPVPSSPFAVAFRADMDALPVCEAAENLRQSKSVLSQKEGVSHLCGHDAHMSLALGLLALAARLHARQQLPGTLLILFESGEENGSGIQAMLTGVEAWRQAHPEQHLCAILGNHVLASLPSNRYALTAGPCMGGIHNVDFTLIGQGGHGSRPDEAINPIFAAAAVLQGLSVAWSQRLDVTETVTLGLCQIHAGTANNVIPETCRISGTLRYFQARALQEALAAVHDVVEQTAAAHRCRVEWHPHPGYDPVINDPPLTEHVQKAMLPLASMLGLEPEVGRTWFASESFSQYRRLAPSVFTFFGIQNPDFGSGAAHHHSQFEVDPDILLPACLLSFQAVLSAYPASEG